MSTWKFLAACLGVLTGVSLLLAVSRDDVRETGQTKLTWVSDNNPTRASQIAGFNQGREDLSVQLDYGNSGVQKVILQSVSGVGPDLFDFSDGLLGTYVESGVLWDVTEAADKMDFSAKDDLWPAAYNTVVFQGRQYGYPCNTSADILVFNKNVFDYFGIEYPEGILTWEEFFALARKVNSATNPDGVRDRDIYAITGLTQYIFFASLRGEYFREDGSLNLRNNEDLRVSLEMYRRALFEEKIMPTSFEARAMSGQGGWGGGSLNQFSSGKYAMAVTGHWSLIAFGRAHQLQREKLQREGISPDQMEDPLQRPIRIGACLLPRFPDREPSYYVGSRVAGINKFSPSREKALEFLKYLSGPKYSAIVNEGTDALPGNPRHARLGVTEGPDDLSRVELQETTERAMKMGYTPRASPYLLSSDVSRILQSQVSRLESNPDIPISSLLEAADREAATLLRRNLDRNPDLKARFDREFGAGVDGRTEVSGGSRS